MSNQTVSGTDDPSQGVIQLLKACINATDLPPTTKDSCYRIYNKIRQETRNRVIRNAEESPPGDTSSNQEHINKFRTCAQDQNIVAQARDLCERLLQYILRLNQNPVEQTLIEGNRANDSALQQAQNITYELVRRSNRVIRRTIENTPTENLTEDDSWESIIRGYIPYIFGLAIIGSTGIVSYKLYKKFYKPNQQKPNIPPLDMTKNSIFSCEHGLQAQALLLKNREEGQKHSPC